MNQSIGVKPNNVAPQANNPETGCISRFFQTSALTVGITKNGAITISRTMLRPITGWSSSSASGVPTRMVMARTEPTNTKVFCREVKKAGSVRKYRKFSRPTKVSLPGSSRL